MTFPARLLALALLALAPYPAIGQVFLNGQSADLVLGQADFTSGTPELGATRMNLPWGLALDPVTGVLFVCDSDNNRILRFASLAAALNGATPEAVFGQVDFDSNNGNQGGPATANTLQTPRGIALDASGNLWVVDTVNHRVLAYANAVTAGNNPAAFLVLGQPDFATVTLGTAADKFQYPDGIAVAPDGTLWVVDYVNCRVLRFDNAAAKANGAAADGVLGQPDFVTTDPGTTATAMNYPYDAVAGSDGTLWVADRDNHRILRFDNAAGKADGAAADGVLGQSTFTSGSFGLAANRLREPSGLHLAADGTLWVADRLNHRVLAFPSAATLPAGSDASVVLGQANFVSGSAATAADRLKYPARITGLPGGALFVSDGGNHRVLRHSPVGPPRLTILTRKTTTTRGSYTVKGSTTGVVTSVSARVGRSGPYKTARGTARWTYRARLKPGKNLVYAFATGPGGTSPSGLVKITRK